jgi:hypothetical protein
LAEFKLPVDIANRACDHCGVGLIDRTEGFTEDSKAALRIGAVYGKLRRTELRRNVWKFAIREAMLRALDTDTMILSAALWVASTTYFVGSIVADEDENLWISRVPNNLNFQPQNTTAWEPYFGPMTVSLYASTVSYAAGELAYTAAGDGTNRVFLSLQNDNTDNPATATAWAATTTYRKNQVITYLTVAYMSLIDLNTGNIPSAASIAWSLSTTYAIGNQAVGSDGYVYTSLTNGNLNHDPTLDAGNWTNTGVLSPWTTAFTGGTGSLKWLQIGGAEFPNGVTLATLTNVYPIGSGPASQSGTLNVYRMPAGFLRFAPQDPKAGSSNALGAPTNRLYEDWNPESDFMVSADAGPIRLRFVADVTDVRKMDDMFCETLGARIGLEVCEPLTQSREKIVTIAGKYKQSERDAIAINGIETGPVEPALDDFLACRA